MKQHFGTALTITLLILWVLTGYSQTSEYTFSTIQSTYTPITAGLLMGTSSSDDQFYLDPTSPSGSSYPAGAGYSIGFNFTFNGVVFDRLGVNNNGWISLGQSVLNPSVNMSSGNVYNPLSSMMLISPDILTNRISALGCNLEGQNGSNIRIETIGTEPNRVCVVQWTNYKKPSTSGTGDLFNFQIQLHETTNLVKIVYGQMQCNATTGNPQVGLRGPSVTDFNARQGISDWNNTTAASTSSQFIMINNINHPTNGLTFSFAYPVANQLPNSANLASPGNGATMINPLTSLQWRSGGGFPSGYRLSLGTNTPPTNLINNQDYGSALNYTHPGNLTYSTTYYWKVVPYNALGDAMNCPVWSFTTQADPTITALPHSQTWDSVTPPSLPFDWTSIVQSSVTTSYVKTVTSAPNTTPNCVGIFNGSDLSSNVILVGPPIAETISVNGISTKVWAKGAGNYHLLVGVMTNPSDPATFVTIQDLTLSASWAQYSVSLFPYTGIGKYIAFKHANASSSQTIYVDGILYEQMVANDLAVITITGNSNPTANQSSSYTIGISNNGASSQNAYSVKLMSGTTELSSVAGPVIAPLGTASVNINWTPSAEGPYSIYGKVVLPGDQNPDNDQSNPYTITVMPAGVQVVTVGTGNLLEGIPWEFYYKSSLFESLYYPSEIGVLGHITSINFFSSFASNITNKPVKLWLGTTQLADLSAGWIPSDQLTLVYDGVLSFPSGANTITVPLQTPYNYAGGNLVVYAKRPLDTAYFNNNDNFRAQTIGTNRARKLTSDTIDFNPAAPEAAGTLSGTFPKVSFTMIVNPVGSLSGTVRSGALPLQGVQVQVIGSSETQITSVTGQYSFPVLQEGNYTVTASKLGYNTISLPVTILANQNSVLDFNLNPSNMVTVTGFIAGSDAPSTGLAGVSVQLDGPVDFNAVTDASGHFSIDAVPMNNTYSFIFQKVGYSNQTGTIQIVDSDYDMGSIIMNELYLPPVHVVATENPAQDQVVLTWRAPGTSRIEDFEIYDGAWGPSSNWSNPEGDWQWTNTYNAANYVAGGNPNNEYPPQMAHSGTGLWGTKLYSPHSNSGGYSYLTKTFYFSGITNPQLKFWSWNNSNGNFDYGQVTVNGDIVWGPAWDTNPVEWEEIIIDLSAYANQASVVVQFQHYASTAVNYAGWYIDDVYVGASQTIAIRQQENRTLNGCKVWRLTQGNETIESNWTLLTNNSIADTTFTDTAWGSMPDGNYRWAVKGVYTNGALGPVAFSNIIRILRNDMTALALTGATTIIYGSQTTHTVRIKNSGTVFKPAGSYTVKLMSGITELSLVPGPAIAPTQELFVPLEWIPNTAGSMALSGKVALVSDTVPANDSSPILNVSVLPTDDLAATAIIGNISPSVGSATIYTVSIYNWGNVIQNTYTIKLLDPSGVELCSAPGIPCAPGLTVQVPVTWIPLNPGAITIHGQVFLNGDQNVQNDASPSQTCLVQPSGIHTITIGDGGQTARIPIDMYWRNSLFETIYYPEELSYFTGTIMEVKFYKQFTSGLTAHATKIWIGTTTQNDLASGWIPSTDLTLVYDGLINIASGTGDLTIPLQTPFVFPNGVNLVMLVEKPMVPENGDAGNLFRAQTAGLTRSRNCYSNVDDYDPASPPAPSIVQLSGQFPKTSFIVVPMILGHLNGIVFNSANQPLEGVEVSIPNTNYSTMTNSLGQYQIHNILPATYTVIFRKYGYTVGSETISLGEAQDLTLNVILQPLPTVTVTGRILASDTGLGINDASVHLTGYAYYSASTNVNGTFSFPAVYVNQTYNYIVTSSTYSSVDGMVSVGMVNYDMGNITLDEIAFAPGNVISETNGTNTEVSISWIAPIPGSLDIIESFEGTNYPPVDWTQSILNTGVADAYGVYPTWCRFGTAMIEGTTVEPSEGSFQSGVSWGFAHQDEWLISPSFYCPSNVILSFDSYVFQGSTGGDHYYIKASTDNGISWSVLWDASAQTGGWNRYVSPIIISLSSYTGQQIKLAWHADDPPTNDGMWYSWFIDNIQISNAQTVIRFEDSELTKLTARSEVTTCSSQKVKTDEASDRSVLGYKVWRLIAGAESDATTWTLLTPNLITDYSINDPAWATLGNGFYRWAVKAVYTGNTLSAPSFSNTLQNENLTGMISGVVRKQTNQPIPGATVTAGPFSATTNNSGAYSIILSTGIYSVTASAVNYQPLTLQNIAVSAGQNTTANFVLIPGSGNDDDLQQVTATELKGNFPNPFTQSTSINYAVKDPAAVLIEIYNTKGQAVKTLVRERKSTGNFQIVWNGTDKNDQTVSSGVYYCHMRSGKLISSRKILLLK